MGFIKGILKQAQLISRPLIPVVWIPLIYTLLSSLGLIFSLWNAGDMFQDVQFHNNTPKSGETFDFIIVGGGSSGSVLANRLSKKYRVLLLEAGGEPMPFQYIPGFGVFFINYPETDWRHRTVPQKYASLNSVNQRASWSAGKVLGGTGTINLMIHLRGHKKDFDNWERVTGDPSWGYDGVLPYFKKYEDYEEGGDKAFHGFGGDLRIETPDYVGMGPEFVVAGQELGYSHCDLNAPFTEGFDLLRYPIKYGIRQAPFQAFIQPIRRFRRNLVIAKFSHVNRILTRDGNVAYGVEYDRHGTMRQAFASKEVILSAGTVGSAKLLMLSGIGPRNHLQDIGIPLVRDLPVGLNLQDHIAAYVGPFFIDKPRSVLLERDLTPAAFVQWFSGGRGILSTTGAHASGIISSSLAKNRGEGNWPDIQYFLFGFGTFKKFGDVFAQSFGLTLDEQKKFYEHAIDKDSFLVAVSGARPFSRGFIKLGGRSPYDSPVIDPRYFSDPGDQDLLAMVEGIKVLMLLTENTTALGHDLGTRYTTERLPGCEHLPFRSNEYWTCYARRYTVTLHHPVGTASIGSVVDTKLRVFGIQNLRVVDSSVQPVLVTTNTQASALMIGEKGADIILKHWKDVEEQEKTKQVNYGPPSQVQYGPPNSGSQVHYGAPDPSSQPPQQYGIPHLPPQEYGIPQETSPPHETPSTSYEGQLLQQYYKQNEAAQSYQPSSEEAPLSQKYGPPYSLSASQSSQPSWPSSSSLTQDPAGLMTYQTPPSSKNMFSSSWHQQRSWKVPIISNNISKRTIEKQPVSSIRSFMSTIYNDIKSEALVPLL